MVVQHLGDEGEQIVLCVFYQVRLVVYWLDCPAGADFSSRCLDIFEEILFEFLEDSGGWLIKITLLIP